MLNLYYSNKLEVLAAQLNANIATNPLPALMPETIVVESAAMSQWLTKQIVQQLGIAANLKFPFPAALVWQIYRQLMPNLPKQSSFDRDVLILRLYQLFNSNEIKKLPELDSYLKQMGNNKQLLFFAEHVADLYDQYQIYRPQWLIDWQQGKYTCLKSHRWQADLWRMLCATENITKINNAQIDNAQIDNTTAADINRAQVFINAMQQMDATNENTKMAVKRLQIFAVATLPQSYIALFSALAKEIEINMYVLNPSALFWSQLQPEKIRIKQAQGELHFDEYSSEQNLVKNELLALMAKQGRDYIELLRQQTLQQEVDCFVEVQNNNLLGYLQNDILTLRQANLQEDKRVIAINDKSMQFHSCHSALREVQVLHNQLLGILDENPDIDLDDIVIMVPELETYAPYFHAVFSTADSNMRLAYHLAERKNFDDQPIKRSLMQLLKIPAQQYRRADITSLLQESSIAAQFGITNLTLINQLLEELQVRFLLHDKEWFAMGEHVVSFSWQQAKNRLLASYASAELLRESESICIEGIYDDAANEAGFLCEFIDQLESLEYQNQSRSLTSWCEYVEQVLQRFFKLDSAIELYEAKTIRVALEKTQQASELAGFSEALAFDLFLHVFEGCLQQQSQHHFFKQDAINIATLLPMRSLPFKVICLLGMNDGEFPRPANTDRIDLMQEFPQQGDRNRREEDRYLFLEAILAARHTCYISYIGRSHIDNTERYPSLLVTELIEHLSDCYQLPLQQDFKQHLLTQHKLQSFDSAYFSGNPSYVCYNAHQLKQAERLMQQKLSSTLAPNSASVFSVKPLNWPEHFSEHYSEHGSEQELSKSQQIKLQDLVNAMVKPSRFYLQQLHIKLEQSELKDESIESFSANALDKYRLLELLFERLIKDEPLPAAAHLSRIGLLPQAMAGEMEYETIKKNVYTLYQQVKSHHLDIGNIRLDINTKLNSFIISGEIDRCNTTSTQRIAVLCNKLHGEHILRAWVNHIFCCSSLPQPLSSYMLTPDACYKLNAIPQAEAEKLLLQLLDNYQKNRIDVSWIFPKSAWAYISLLSKDAIKAEKELCKQLYSSERSVGEWDTLHNAYVYRGKTVDMERIISQAQILFYPILDYFEELPMVASSPIKDEL